MLRLVKDDSITFKHKTTDFLQIRGVQSPLGRSRNRQCVRKICQGEDGDIDLACLKFNQPIN